MYISGIFFPKKQDLYRPFAPLHFYVSAHHWNKIWKKGEGRVCQEINSLCTTDFQYYTWDFDCKLIEETFCQNFSFILWACNLHFILIHSMENMNVVPGKWATTSFHIAYKSGDYNQMQKQCISPDSEASTFPYKSFSCGMDSKWVCTNPARLIPQSDDTYLGNVYFTFCMTCLSKNVPPINIAGLGHIQSVQTPDASSRALGYLFLAYDHKIWCIFETLPTSLKNDVQLFWCCQNLSWT